ncbi:MAG: hypothetical protein ACK48G_11140 [Chitinophagaceae bacterium]|jgi:hypothetical protein
MMFKSAVVSTLLFLTCFESFGQREIGSLDRKREEKIERRNRINEMIRNEEEGVPAFAKHSLFSMKLHHDGYGFLYEKGWMKSPYKSTIFQLEFSEKQHRKEEKQGSSSFSNSGLLIFGRPFVYGKQNIFYQVKAGLGRQVLIGGKSNKNGVGVYWVTVGGFSAGLVRPYYIELNSNPGTEKIKFSEETRRQFLNSQRIIGGTGLQLGWNEIKFNPGAYLKSGLRFDWARFNQVVSAVEFGFGVDYYSQKVEQMVDNPSRSFFPTGYIGLVFGNRK